MLRFLFSLTIVLSVLNPLIAQKIISTIKLGSSPLKNLQGFRSGDTLFVSYFEHRELGKDIIKALHVFPSGVTKIVNLKNISIITFCGFENSFDGLYDYYFEKKKKDEIVLRALFIDKFHGSQQILNDEIPIDNKIIGVFNENGILIITRNESKNSISVYRIKKLQKISVEEYLLPDKFSYVATHEFQLIPSTAGWIYETNSKAKIYLKNETLFLTRDHQSGTEVITLDPSSTNTKSIFIPERTDPNCNSFLCDSLLFRFTITKMELSVKVYKIDDAKLLQNKSFKIDDAEDGNKVYFYSGFSHETSHLDKISRIVKNDLPSIAVNKISSTKYAVTFGSVYYSKAEGDNSHAESGVVPQLYYVYAPIEPLHDIISSYYMNCTYENGDFDFRIDSRIINKRIDNLNITMSKKVRFEDILITSLNSAFIIAQNLRTNSLEIIKVSE